MIRYPFLLVYNPTDVLLVLSGKPVPFSDIVITGNAHAAAKCFDSLTNNPSATTDALVSILDAQTPSQMYQSFNEMQPANFNNIAFAEENIAERIRQIYTDHFYEQKAVPCEERGAIRFWAAPFAEMTRQHGNGYLPGYKQHFAGFAAALDFLTQKHWTFAAGFSYASANMSVPHGKVHADINTYAGSFGIAWTDKHWFFDGIFSYLYNAAYAKRKMRFASNVGSMQLTAKHKERAGEYLGHLGGGYNIKASESKRHTVNIYPFWNVDYMYLVDGKYRESGARRLDLIVDSKRYDLLRPEGGLGIGYAGCFNCWNMQFDVAASYVREIRYLGKKTQSRFKGNSCNIHTTGLKPENNLISPYARLRFFSSQQKKTLTSLTLGYHGEFGSHFIDNACEAELKFSF